MQKMHMGGVQGTAPLILNQRTRWRWVVSFTTQPLILGKESSVPME